MGRIEVTYSKFSKMASETKSTAEEYRKLIEKMKSEVVSPLNGMTEPSLPTGIAKMNEVIAEMEQTAANLEKIASDLQWALNKWKKVQEDAEKAANGLKGLFKK